MSDFPSISCGTCGQVNHHPTETCPYGPQFTIHHTGNEMYGPGGDQTAGFSWIYGFNGCNFDTQQQLPPNAQLLPSPQSDGPAMSRQTSVTYYSPITPQDQILANTRLNPSNLTMVPQGVMMEHNPLISYELISTPASGRNDLAPDILQTPGPNNMAITQDTWIQPGNTYPQPDKTQANEPINCTNSVDLSYMYELSPNQSSMVSGASPVFSWVGTPSLALNSDSFRGSPYSLGTAWTPGSTGYKSITEARLKSQLSASPQARKIRQASKRLQQMQHLEIPQQHNKQRVNKTDPTPRSRPRAIHSYSDSSLPNLPNSRSDIPASSVATHRRVPLSNMFLQSEWTINPDTNDPSLELPSTPSHQGFVLPTPISGQNPFTQSRIQQNRPEPGDAPQDTTEKCASSTKGDEKSSNNTADVEEGHGNEPPELNPENCLYGQEISHQLPLSEGDVYTPLHKRRDIKGKYNEGWCRFCSPGEWLSMKTSRYRDHMQRFHGICARTKRTFDDPINLRVVDINDQEVDQILEHHLVEDTAVSSAVATKFINHCNNPLWKREGQCGRCLAWVSMTSARGKDKVKNAGWWLHAAEVSVIQDEDYVELINQIVP